MKSPSVRALLRCFAPPDWTKTFTSGVAFLESVREHNAERRPDCLVLDLHLPGLTGLDVQRQLKSEEISIPIIMVTGNEEAGIQNGLSPRAPSDFFRSLSTTGLC